LHFIWKWKVIFQKSARRHFLHRHEPISEYTIVFSSISDGIIRN
jgi:hypothetical protein